MIDINIFEFYPEMGLYFIAVAGIVFAVGGVILTIVSKRVFRNFENKDANEETVSACIIEISPVKRFSLFSKIDRVVFMDSENIRREFLISAFQSGSFKEGMEGDLTFKGRSFVEFILNQGDSGKG